MKKKCTAASFEKRGEGGSAWGFLLIVRSGKRIHCPGTAEEAAALARRGVSHGAVATADDDVLLISRQGMSVRFTASDHALRPMGRSTSGVRGMNFRDGDALLSASRIGDDGGFVFVVTEGGYAKRTDVTEYRVQQRGGFGIKVAKLAGLPPAVVERARAILGELEKSEREKPVAALVDDLPLFAAQLRSPANPVSLRPRTMFWTRPTKTANPDAR